MAIRPHLFVVNEDETVRRLPAARYYRLWQDASAGLPAYANQRCRVAEVIVEYVDRLPLALHSR
jgi:hypothetical protein